MTREKNKRHRLNRKKKQMEFSNIKASFVAGCTILIMCINDTLELFINIPVVVDIIEAVFVLIIFGLILGTPKLDLVLKKKGVNDFGAFLTICGIIAFVFERTIIKWAGKTDFELNPFNTKFMVIILMSAYVITILIGAFQLLFKKIES